MTSNDNSGINVDGPGDQPGDSPSAPASSLLIDTDFILEATTTDPVTDSAHFLDTMHCITCNVAISDPFSHTCEEQRSPNVMDEEAEDSGMASGRSNGEVTSVHIVDVVTDNTLLRQDQDTSVEKQDKEVYFCDVCGQSFHIIQNFRRHQYKHSEEAKFKCDQCGKAYKWPGSLEYHVDSVHSLNEYICNVCLKKFKTKVTLIQHKKMPDACVKNMNRPKNLTCDFCGRSFSTVGNYKRHGPLCKARHAKHTDTNLS